MISLMPAFSGSTIAGADLTIDDLHVWRVFGGDAGDELLGSDVNASALSETAAGFLAYSGALAAYAGDLSSLVLADVTGMEIDVAQLLGAAPLFDLISGVNFVLDDTAAAIETRFDDLVSVAGELYLVSVADAGPIHVTQAQYDGAAALLSRLGSDWRFSVAQTDGTTHLYAQIGLIDRTTILDANGVVTSVTTSNPLTNYDQVVKTYAVGELVSAEYDGVMGKAYTHIVRSYEDGHLVQEQRDGFVSGDLTARTIDYDAAGTVRFVTSTYTNRDFQTLAVGYDADGQLESRTRGGLAGPVDAVTTYYHADGTAYATRTALDDGTSRLVGSKADDALSLALADTVRGRGGADTFVVSADHANGGIVDFHRAEGDRIDLSHLFASASDAHFVGTAAFGGDAGEIRFDRVDGGVFVQIDMDSDTAADVTFAANGYGVTASDFVL